MISLTMGFACVLFAAAGDGKVEELKLLQATLTSVEGGKVRVVLQNKTDKPVGVNKQVLECGSLSLEVRNAAGKVIPSLPPPIPKPVPEMVVIPAGGEHSQSYDLNFFSPALEDGVYRVRLRLNAWKSNELQHAVKKK